MKPVMKGEHGSVNKRDSCRATWPTKNIRGNCVPENDASQPAIQPIHVFKNSFSPTPVITGMRFNLVSLAI